ncbi:MULTISPECIES: peptide MFS transporter [Proteiniphilum]|jgi:POT family proton-dependent oligopeptide transporter|uniref:peptide MFS transporter n=1 Tax=Proteiniphilum TaxID=294702 RepID=UPI001EEC56EA|nr:MULTISPECIES: peptide MFS transporter [Proteiniphilum]ULB33148.1 peptide MFS transporter [Proteiniphilum propionicum]
MTANSAKHPKGLYFVFSISIAERFGYYGMRALFVLYMIKALMIDKELSSLIYGNYTGLVYLTPLIGGYVADKYWGMRRSVLLGTVLMVIGQLFMFFSALYFQHPEAAKLLMYTGLGALIFGNGFFKPNVSTFVGQLYEPGDRRLDSAYTIFYMGVNLGAFAAPLICGFLGDTGNPADFKWGFLVAALVSVICLILFVARKDKYLVDPHGNSIGVEPAAMKKSEKTGAATIVKYTFKEIALWFLGTIALFAGFMYLFNNDFIGALIYTATIIVPAFVISDKSLTKIERHRIWVIYIIAFFVIFFWSAFEQAGISLTYFAAEQTNREILGWTMPTSWFQSFNAVFVILLAPIFARLWLSLGAKNIEPSSPVKQAVGLLLLSLGYLLIAFGVQGVEPGVKVSILWLTGLYFIHTMGELCLSPIGLSMVNKLSPVRFASLLMGVWYLSMATANKLAGALSSLYPEEGKVKSLLGIEISTLFDFFMVFVVMAAVASFILLLLSRQLNKLMHGVR